MQKYYPEIYFPKKLIEFNRNWRKIVLDDLTPQSIEEPKKPEESKKEKFDINVMITVPLLLSIFIYFFIKNLLIPSILVISKSAIALLSNLFHQNLTFVL